MDVAFGKTRKLSLTPITLKSQVDDGERNFFAAAPSAEAQRASFLVNEVVRTTFGKTVSPVAPAATRAAIEADKVEAAAFKDDATGAVRVVYREVTVQFEPKTSAATRKKVLDRFGLQERSRSAFSPLKVIAVDPKRRYVAERVVELANQLTESDEVAFAFPNFVSEFYRDAVPTVQAAQWHLKTVAARAAWATSLGANTITVAVLDDGVDVDHPNLKRRIRGNPDPNEARDLCGRDFFVGENAPDHFNPRPKRFIAPFNKMRGNDIHGTPCAGVIAADGTNGGIRGVAPGCRILPVKVFHADDLATESRVADAIRYASMFADILSCSWSGPQSPDIEAALRDAAQGRGGKGCPIFVATGNFHPRVGRVSYPASSDHVIAIGASTDGEDIADYSQRGPEVAMVAPSNGGTHGITTTDVSEPNRGFNMGVAADGGVDGLFTNSFGGTSSATPLAAGIGALVLSVDPSLTRDQVKDILQRTAEKIGPAGSYDANGHSDTFGFGRVSADRAVADAKAGRSGVGRTVAHARPRPRSRKRPRRAA